MFFLTTAVISSMFSEGISPKNCKVRWIDSGRVHRIERPPPRRFLSRFWIPTEGFLDLSRKFDRQKGPQHRWGG